MNTPDRIKAAALDLFASQGYEGTSMANIAEAVGIKTPSIYAHFKGKEELFLSVLQDASRGELEFASSHLEAGGEALGRKLYKLLSHTRGKYEHNGSTKFWIRMMYFPPASVYRETIDLSYTYLSRMEELLTSVFTEDRSAIGVDPDKAAAAFLCLMDGVIVELLYGTAESYDKRLEASWDVYWRGISHS
ncbi:TetR family transcriptional regulator [Paenibacillus chitinolyticus]|uniref:TetR/AcrR family transcriptional regulator n=1 Tax=Paenibacillus chitinolyticus TaxID=79263 RepID=UPI0026E4AABB|nr:TetR/AcrR family transcriptional regulator [Paenibacillus chitinolyticus]GKS10795.1 TetR family transcriptional regulator [Paenibacillus chitinolyticus]